MKIILAKPTFYKARRTCNNFTKLVEVGKHFTKFIKFANNFTKFAEFANNFTKLAEVRKNFAKFANSQTTLQSSWDSPTTFGKSIRPPKTLWSFWIGRSDLSAWKFFHYLSFTRSTILLGKHKCFVNTFHVSWILFTNKLNRGRYIRVGKIFGTVKKWSLVALDRWSFYAV